MKFGQSARRVKYYFIRTMESLFAVEDNRWAHIIRNCVWLTRFMYIAGYNAIIRLGSYTTPNKIVLFPSGTDWLTGWLMADWLLLKPPDIHTHKTTHYSNKLTLNHQLPPSITHLISFRVFFFYFFSFCRILRRFILYIGRPASSFLCSCTHPPFPHIRRKNHLDEKLAFLKLCVYKSFASFTFTEYYKENFLKEIQNETFGSNFFFSFPTKYCLTCFCFLCAAYITVLRVWSMWYLTTSIW